MRMTLYDLLQFPFEYRTEFTILSVSGHTLFSGRKKQMDIMLDDYLLDCDILDIVPTSLGLDIRLDVYLDDLG